MEFIGLHKWDQGLHTMLGFLCIHLDDQKKKKVPAELDIVANVAKRMYTLKKRGM